MTTKMCHCFFFFDFHTGHECQGIKLENESWAYDIFRHSNTEWCTIFSSVCNIISLRAQLWVIYLPIWIYENVYCQLMQAVTAVILLAFSPSVSEIIWSPRVFSLTLVEFYQLLSEFSTAPHGVWLINHNESNEKQNPQFCLVWFTTIHIWAQATHCDPKSVRKAVKQSCICQHLLEMVQTQSSRIYTTETKSFSLITRRDFMFSNLCFPDALSAFLHR